MSTGTKMILLGTMVVATSVSRPPVVWAQSDASTKVETRIFDIRALLLEVPDYRATFSDLRSDDLYGGNECSPPQMFPIQAPAQKSPEDDAQKRQRNATQVRDMIFDVVDPGSWEHLGGRGSARLYAGQLVVVNTPENLDRVDHLLTLLKASRTTRVSLHAYFVFVSTDPASRAGFQEVLDQATVAQGEYLFGQDKFADLLEAAEGITVIRASVSGFDGQRVYVSAGEQHNVVVGAVPVVASGATAEQPITRQLLDGVTLEAQPVLDRDRNLCLVDLRASVARVGTRRDSASSGQSVFQQSNTAPPYRVAHFATSVALPLDHITLVSTGRYSATEDLLLYLLPSAK